MAAKNAKERKNGEESKTRLHCRLEKTSALSAFCVFLRSLWPIHFMKITRTPTKHWRALMLPLRGVGQIHVAYATWICPSGFMVPTRDFEIVEAFHEPCPRVGHWTFI